jgi:membrane fusion protein, multidrug efflux system
MKFRLMALLLVIIATPLLFLFFSPKNMKKISSDVKAVRVETTVVIEKSLASQFETLGSLSSRDNIEISSELAGQIASIHFKPGAKVKKGTLLIELDNTVLKSELASANANLSLSETNYKRTKELADRKLASEQALDQAVADLREKQNTGKLSLHAPFSGTLGSKKVSVGQYVKVGQPLISLVANQQLRVEYSLPERLISRIHEGQEIQVLVDAFPNQSYHGQVNYIAPAVDKETRTISIEALINNDQNQLSAGLFVQVIHQLGAPKKRLLVPEESLIPTINGQKIFVLQGDKAVTKRIKTGAHHNGMTEIYQGLHPGDIIIVRGQHKLKEGSKVIATTLSE